MDELAERLCAQGEYVGLSVLVTQKASPIYRKLCGYADQERQADRGRHNFSPVFDDRSQSQRLQL
ncbi:MAG: hypothetical protein ACLU9S_21485 [Oscillospiraceae bacterium]